MFSNVWSENTALFERLMEIHSNSPPMALTVQPFFKLNLHNVKPCLNETMDNFHLLTHHGYLHVYINVYIFLLEGDVL